MSNKWCVKCIVDLFTELLGETVWKIERGRSMTYAPEHEKELLNHSHRRRMGVPEAPCSGSQQAGTTENPHHPRDSKRHLLRPKERMSLGLMSRELSALRRRRVCSHKMTGCLIDIRLPG